MLKFASWKEYLDGKGKLVEKPEVDPTPDYKGPDDKAPPTAVTKGKSWDTKAPKADKPKPYKPANSGKPAQKGEAGFADKGDGKLVYKPNTKVDKAGEGGKKIGSWPKTKTEAFIEKTKDMSMSQFIEHMIGECGCEMDETLPTVTAYASGKFHPYPPEAIRYVVALAEKNERIMDKLIFELKNAGALPKMLKSLMEHPESYDGMTDLFGDLDEGPKRCKAFARSMDESYNKFMKEQSDLYESVGPPFGLSDEDAESDEGLPQDKDDTENMGTEDCPDCDKGEEGQEMPHDNGDTDVDDENGEEDMMPSGENDIATSPAKKLKKKFAEDHLLDSLGTNERILGKMKSYLQ